MVRIRNSITSIELWNPIR